MTALLEIEESYDDDNTEQSMNQFQCHLFQEAFSDLSISTFSSHSMSSHHIVSIWNYLQHGFTSILFILNKKNISSLKAGSCFACSWLYSETSNILRTTEEHNRHSHICWINEEKSLTDQAFRQSCLILNTSLNCHVSYW